MNLKINKKAIGILATALMLTIGTTAFAAEQEQGKSFADADGDGICDNYVPNGRKGIGSGQNRNFVDADNDGVCDNYVSGQCQGNGFGCGPQGIRGNGCRGRHNR